MIGIPKGRLQRIGYAVATRHGPGFAVYAERAIPANRRVPVESDSAFADIDFATYLGTQVRGADLATTDVPRARSLSRATRSATRFPSGIPP